MRARSLSCLGVAFAWLMPHAIADAQTPPSDRGLARPSAAAVEQARALYEEGVKFYNVASYPQAIDSFRRAYLLDPRPSLLYDIAQAYRLTGPSGCDNALQFYRSYLREEPDAPDRASVLTQVRAMEECARS